MGDESRSPRWWIAARGANVRRRLRLICLPFAGGGAATYAQWPEPGPGVEVVPVRLPGRESRFTEAPLTSVPALVAALREGLAALFDEPFAFYGHSFGALLAFELTRALEAEGHDGPVMLHAGASAAPQLHLPGESLLGSLDDAALVARLRALGGTSDDVLEDPELLALTLPALRADALAAESYRPEPNARVRCPIVAIGGVGDPFVTEPLLSAWADCTSAQFKLRQLPGGHFFLDGSRALLLKALAQDLAAFR